METIKIGKTEFLAQALREITLQEAQAQFEHLDRRIVFAAWTIANPKAKKKAPKKESKKEEKNED